MGQKEVRVPKGHLWLQGDNPANSTDSRHYGPIPMALVRGRVAFKMWPLHEMGRVELLPQQVKAPPLSKKQVAAAGVHGKEEVSEEEVAATGERKAMGREEEALKSAREREARREEDEQGRMEEMAVIMNNLDKALDAAGHHDRPF